MLPVALKVPATGSKISAVAVAAPADWPPAKSTCPLGSVVTVSKQRATVMLPVAEDVAAAGSYISAGLLAEALPGKPPPV
jgi:hypothetical protein